METVVPEITDATPRTQRLRRVLTRVGGESQKDTLRRQESQSSITAKDIAIDNTSMRTNENEFWSHQLESLVRESILGLKMHIARQEEEDQARASSSNIMKESSD